MVLNIVESINTAKVFAKQLEEEIFNLMDAHNIDAIQREGAKNKVEKLHNALAEIEKASKRSKPKPVEKKPELRPTPTKMGNTPIKQPGKNF